MTTKPRFLIYGANGYTGKLCIEAAKRRGHSPIVAGRHPQRMLELAQATACETRVFTLDTPEEIASKLAGATAVLNCAGPFARTSGPLLAACARAGVHYLDITGEIDVFEFVFAQDRRIREAGIAAIPGVGCDVVPTDCLAAMLKARLPDANKLWLAIDARQSQASPGTLKTAVESLSKGCRVRRNGKIIPLGGKPKSLTVPFPNGSADATSVAWGDVATAYHSTQIANIEVYMALPKSSQRWLRLGNSLAPLLRLPFVAPYVSRQITRRISGPTAEQRKSIRTGFWGRVDNAAGRSVTLGMLGPEGYDLTAEAAILAVERVLAGGIAAGPATPSMAFGAEFVLAVPGMRLLA